MDMGPADHREKCFLSHAEAFKPVKSSWGTLQSLSRRAKSPVRRNGWIAGEAEGAVGFARDAFGTRKLSWTITADKTAVPQLVQTE
jgi:hypothetical protein